MVTATTRRVNVPKAKIRPDGQVRIPAALTEKYRLKEGDVLDVRDLGGGIMFIPEKAKKNKKLRKELNECIWDRMEQEAEDDIKAGRVSGPFETAEELLKDLKS